MINLLKMIKDQNDEFDPQYESLKNSKFKQQKMLSWRPTPTIGSTTITFAIFGCLFILVGIVIISFSNQIIEKKLRYDEVCKQPSSQPKCFLDFKLNEKLVQPIMFYYEIINFYQDNRKYLKSKSNVQLSGENLNVEYIQRDCDPIVLNKHLDKKFSLNGTPLDPEAPANPCGLIAKSAFNDTYKLFFEGKPVTINDKGIAWSRDIERYKRHPNYESVQWLDVTDEHFMVWMRPTGVPDFRKLWGKIETDLSPGTYQLVIDNLFLIDSDSNNKIEKHIVLSTVSALGGNNKFLGIAYITVGSICLVMSILFFVGYKSHKS